MIPKWSPIVFVRYAFFFCAGILFYIHSDWEIPASEWIWALCGGAYLALAFLGSRKLKRKWKSLFGILAFASLFLFGYWLTDLRTEQNSVTHLLKLDSPIEFYKATVISEVQEKEKSFKAELQVSKVYADSAWQSYEGKIIAYFSKQDSLYQPKYGDLLVVKGAPQLISAPQNPHEFDYRRYLAFHQIHHQQFLRAPYYQLVGNQKISEIYAKSLSIRHSADSVFKRHIASQQSYAIATALVLGVKDGLDNDIKKAYSSAGAMHVLAVSGLHVGIIFQILAFVLGFLKKKKKYGGPWLFAIVALTLLWTYAFVTGLSASVLRAVTMFSFIIVAQAWGKQTNIYNTLAISATVLLCWNPYMLTEVGFQLSYTAVVGIVYLQPKFAALWAVENRLYKWAWELTCVSVAAQIATFPIGLLYFHQFPTYFWLSNFIVIPAASVILQLGIGILLFSWFEWLVNWLGWLLDYLIYGLNQAVFFIQELPSALLQGIDISVAETWLIYACIFSIILLFALRKLQFFGLTAMLTIILAGIQYQQVFAHSKQKMLAVYHTNPTSNLCLINGGQAILLGDSALVNDPDKMQFHIMHHFWAKNIEQVFSSDWANSQDQPINTQLIGENQLIVWEGKTILLYNQILENFDLSVDYLIIQQNSAKHWDDIASINTKNIIFDSSNSFYTIRDFKKSLPKEGELPAIHITREQGAFLGKLAD